MEESPANHEDKKDIPHVLDVIKDLGKATEPLVTTSKQKVELWSYNSSLVWKTGEIVVSLADFEIVCYIPSILVATGYGLARRNSHSRARG